MDTEDIDTADMIIEELEQGNFRIEHCQDCNCSFKWDIDENGDLTDDVDTDACWEGNVLYVTLNDCDERVAEFIRYERLNVFIDGMSVDDIPDNVLDKMRISDMRERGETGNPDCHEARRKEALVEYLMDCGYELDTNYNRGFANEYTMVLRRTKEPTYPTHEEADAWAESFLYSGDAATESFVNFRYDDESE
jgi:hypothetical protein